MSTQNWTVAEAKAKFGELITLALSEGPQSIIKRGRIVAIVVGAGEWERKTKRTGTLAEFFRESPLRGSGVRFRRSKSKLRKKSLSAEKDE